MSAHLRVGVAAVAVCATLAGCGDVVEGKPVADPAQTGSAADGGSAGSTAAPGALLETTCGEFRTMTRDEKNAVLDAMGKAGSELVNTQDRELILQIVATSCATAMPSLPVKTYLLPPG